MWGRNTLFADKRLSDFAAYEGEARAWWEQLAQAETFGYPLFLDASRRLAMESLLKKAHSLNAKRLKGQRSCFLITGPRGVGKSAFVKGILARVAALADKSVLVARCDLTAGRCTPKQIIDDELVKANICTCPAGPGPELADTIECMRQAKLRALLFFDGLENVFMHDDELSETIHQQLHEIATEDGTRYVIAIASGSASASVLRKLALEPRSFADDLHSLKKYPLLPKVNSLNDQKFLPLSLRPVDTFMQNRSISSSNDNEFALQPPLLPGLTPLFEHLMLSGSNGLPVYDYAVRT
eukprot:m51a1_g11241 hypothetical protein (297) ;mRNA; r:12973-14217